VNDPLEQLQLDLSYSDGAEISLRNIGSVRSVICYQCKISDFSPALNELSMEQCEIMNPESCPPLRCLRTENYKLSAGDRRLVNALTMLETVALGAIPLSNYQGFCHLKTIEITRDNSLRDVSCFRNVLILRITSCKNVTDVSSLGNIRELLISACPGVTDVSALEKVYNLNLSYSDNISDVSALGNVRILNLDCCPQIRNVSALRNIYELHLEHCGNLVDVTALENVEILSLSGSVKVDKLTGFKKIKELNIVCCTAVVTDFKRMTQLKKLVVGYRYRVERLPFEIADGVEILKNLKESEMTRIVTETEDHLPGQNILSWHHMTSIQQLRFSGCYSQRFLQLL
jgi:hypothetical protein